jgi:hypothetical protein
MIFPEQFLLSLFPGAGGYLPQYKHQGLYFFNASSKSQYLIRQLTN